MMIDPDWTWNELEEYTKELEEAGQELVDEIVEGKVINWPKLKKLRDNLSAALTSS